MVKKELVGLILKKILLGKMLVGEVFLDKQSKGAAAYGRFSLSIFKNLGTFIKIGTLFFSKFLVLGAAISLIAGLLFIFLKKAWPTLKGGSL